jgi:hypothetical protein
MPITSPLTESQPPLATSTGHLSMPFASRKLSIGRSISSRVTLVEPGSPPKALFSTINAGNLSNMRYCYYSVPIKAAPKVHFRDMNKANSFPRHHISQALIVVGNDSVTIPDENNSKRNGLVLLPGRSVTKQEFHAADSASDSSSKASPPWECDQTDYQRLMRAFFRAPASRIPIPVAWRGTAPRAYSFRGPTSPFQRVATAPVPRTKKNTKPAAPVYATEPRRATSSRIPSPTPATNATTKYSAKCYSSCLTDAENLVTDESNRHLSRDEHAAVPTPARPSTLTRGRRLRYVKTLPLNWSPEKTFGERRLTSTYTGIAKPATTVHSEDVWFDASEDTVEHESTD